MRIKTDVCIIGGGSGGLSIAAGAAQMGAKVVLLEGHKMGGDCLNYGCVPSKALLAAGNRAQVMRAGNRFGVTPSEPAISYSDAKDHVRQVIETIAPVDSQERFECLGVHVIREFGRFISKTEVQAGDDVIQARRFVIATGSSPFIPPVPGLENVPYETNETIFELRQRPEHLLVVGGGPIGLELAQAHVRLGCKVTVIEGFKAMGHHNPEMAAIVLDQMRAEGIVIAEDALAAEIRGKAGDITVQTNDGRIFAGSHLLIAAGRMNNMSGLGLDVAGIEHDRAINVDAGLRTTNRRVYAVGDVAGGLQFTHVAGYHAGVVIRSMLFGLRAKQRTDHIPWATYTDPELAQVGLSEAQAREKYGAKLQVVRSDYGENDRAIATSQTTGLINVMVVSGRPVGASIVGAQAGELIGIWSLVIANRLKMSAVANMVVPYPTLGEINKRVAGAYFSPRLFDSAMVKRVVGFVQKMLP
jgi:pyruvate/2-oxoglutarate dehydrogenase complex dihydrolipoamide dehydrogenase (E3) component